MWPTPCSPLPVLLFCIKEWFARTLPLCLLDDDRAWPNHLQCAARHAHLLTLERLCGGRVQRMHRVCVDVAYSARHCQQHTRATNDITALAVVLLLGNHPRPRVSSCRSPGICLPPIVVTLQFLALSHHSPDTSLPIQQVHPRAMAAASDLPCRTECRCSNWMHMPCRCRKASPSPGSQVGRTQRTASGRRSCRPRTRCRPRCSASFSRCDALVGNVMSSSWSGMLWF